MTSVAEHKAENYEKLGYASIIDYYIDEWSAALKSISVPTPISIRRQQLELEEKMDRYIASVIKKLEIIYVTSDEEYELRAASLKENQTIMYK